MPPRRRKNSQDQTGPVARPSLEGGLGPKTKGLADLAPGPAAGRREARVAEALPPGMVDRRKPTATPSARGRRRTMPPIPDRAERDRLASMSTGFAPGLASESRPIPIRAKSSSTPPPVPSDAEPRAAAPAPETGQPQPGTEPTPAKAPARATSARRADSAGTAPPPAAQGEEEWPAPATTAAAHPDDWDLDATRVETSPGDEAAEGETIQDAPAPMGAEAAADLARPRAKRQSKAKPRTKAKPPPVDPAASSQSAASTAWPPPTRMTAVFEPFKAPDILPIPSVPEAGLVPALKYTIAFARARWQRRGAIGELQEQIRKDTGVLDGILGTLGKHTRALGVKSKALEAENRSLDEAEDRRQTADHECSEITNRQADESSKFADSESERSAKVSEGEAALEHAQGELGGLEAQKRGLRDKRKSIETRQKGYIKAAESRDSEAGKQEIGSKRDELRQGAESLRRDAAGLDQERQDIERRLEALEQPIAQASSRVDALKSDLDAAKRALTDVREGHRHRIAELDAEQGRKSRELAQAEAEIQRRLVTLGTIVNLNRIDREEFRDLYEQIDTLRAAIGARSNEIDKLSAEREAFDKASLVRGACVLGGAFVLFLSLLAVILAIS